LDCLSIKEVVGVFVRFSLPLHLVF
jgi:hypothetical protein